MKLFRQAKRICAEQSIINALDQRTCHRIITEARRPFRNKHVQGGIGDVVFADVMYRHQRSRAYPAVLFAEAVARFRPGSILKDVNLNTAVSCLLHFATGYLAPLAVLSSIQERISMEIDGQPFRICLGFL